MATSFTVALVYIFLSFIPESLLLPRLTKGWIKPRSLVATVIHLLSVGLVFLVVFLVLHRPIFAGLVALGTLSVLVIVSNAKYKTLREPLVFSDIVMFSQAFKHPRLYLPFLGIIPAIAAPIIAVVAIVTVINYEPAYEFQLKTWVMTLGLIILSLVIIKRLTLKLSLTQDPITDIKQYGLLATLLGYSNQARTAQHQQLIEVALSASPMKKQQVVEHTTKLNKSNSPNIVVIQSESFFDARRLHASIKPSILENYDQFCKESLFHGRLNVPAWGANTMRTEFSFLTGIPSENLGFYRFYPYHYLSTKNIPSLASYLSQQGYYCICVHPHPASFFGRDRIFPKMGFDEFIDIESFDGSKEFGPYLSDKAVTDKIVETLEAKTKQDKPIFIFAITMENHGPLHLEKTDSKDVASLYQDTPPENDNDLTVYLRHLRNADQMLADLREALTQLEDDSVLCFYGDHVPSMPKIYQTTAYEDESTDYFIWKSKGGKSGKQQDLSAENLAEGLIKYPL